MIAKGCQKRVIVINRMKSRYFESAYFVLKGGLPLSVSERDMIAEAERLVGVTERNLAESESSGCEGGMASGNADSAKNVRNDERNVLKADKSSPFAETISDGKVGSRVSDAAPDALVRELSKSPKTAEKITLYSPELSARRKKSDTLMLCLASAAAVGAVAGAISFVAAVIL